jgi:hypothetical protein
MTGFFNAKRGEGIRSLFFRANLSPLYLSKNSIQGMDGKIEAKGVGFVLEQERTWIGRRGGEAERGGEIPPSPLYERGEGGGIWMDETGNGHGACPGFLPENV